jgi:hypothetical protein
MKTFGRLYVGKLDYYHRKPLPVIEKGWTQETEHPFRKGNCLVFRAPFTFPGVYLGVFQMKEKGKFLSDEEVDTLIRSAMNGRDMGVEVSEIEDWEI